MWWGCRALTFGGAGRAWVCSSAADIKSQDPRTLFCSTSELTAPSFCTYAHQHQHSAHTHAQTNKQASKKAVTSLRAISLFSCTRAHAGAVPAHLRTVWPQHQGQGAQGALRLVRWPCAVWREYKCCAARTSSLFPDCPWSLLLLLLLLLALMLIMMMMNDVLLLLLVVLMTMEEVMVTLAAALEWSKGRVRVPLVQLRQGARATGAAQAGRASHWYSSGREPQALYGAMHIGTHPRHVPAKAVSQLHAAMAPPRWVVCVVCPWGLCQRSSQPALCSYGPPCAELLCAPGGCASCPGLCVRLLVFEGRACLLCSVASASGCSCSLPYSPSPFRNVAPASTKQLPSACACCTAAHRPVASAAPRLRLLRCPPLRCRLLPLALGPVPVTAAQIAHSVPVTSPVFFLIVNSYKKASSQNDWLLAGDQPSVCMASCWGLGSGPAFALCWGAWAAQPCTPCTQA